MILEKASNGFDRVAILEFDGEWMLCQRDTGLLLICLQGRFEKGLKPSGFMLVGHVASRQEKGCLVAGLVNCKEMIARECDVCGVKVCIALSLESSAFDHVTSSVPATGMRSPLTLVVYAAPAIALDYDSVDIHFGCHIPLPSFPLPFSPYTRPLRSIFVFNHPLPGLGQADNDRPLFSFHVFFTVFRTHY